MPGLKKSYLFMNVILIIFLLSFVPERIAASSDPFPEYANAVELTKPLNSAATIYDGAVGKEHNHDVLYTTSKGVPAMFYVIDLDENKLLHSFPLEGAADSWQHEVAPNGTVYIAAGKNLWRYSPETKDVKVLASIPESSLWALAVDEESNAYVGTYPNGKVFQYHSKTGELRDYGKMIGVKNQEYVRSMDYHQGYIYAGTADKKIIKLNVETGEKEDISQPLNETGFVYDLDIVDEQYLFARYSASKTMYIYDLQEQKWLDVKMENVNGLHVADSLNNKVFFIADEKLKYIDLSTLQIGETSIPYKSSLRGADWVEIENDSRLPGKSLVTISIDGKVNFFNIETETFVQYPSVIPPSANVINKIYAYSEDKIYISGMTGTTGAVYNPQTNSSQSFVLGQADSIHHWNNHIYFGVYPDGSVQSLDPNVEPSGAVSKLFAIGNEQDRLHTITDGGGKLFIGSIATYGKLGGALTVFDGQSHKVYRNIVENQSIIGLAYKDGKVYGSTTIYGGLGSQPTAEEAKIFVWDPVLEKKMKETSLTIDGLEKPEHIGDLVVGPKDGYIWGASKGVVFALHPDTLEVVKSVEVVKYPLIGAWNSIHLEWSKSGLLYANIGNQLYVIDPETLKYQFIVNTVSFTLGKDGNIYFSKYNNRTVLAKISVFEKEKFEWGQIPVTNASFENGRIGWTSMFQTGVGYTYSVTNEKAHSGQSSLKIDDASRNQSVAIYSDPIPVQPNGIYKSSVHMFIESGTPSLLVRIYDKDGNQLAEETIQVKNASEQKWQYVEQKITAPEYAAFARLFALSTSYALTSTYFDDFSFFALKEKPETIQKIYLTIAPTELTRGIPAAYSVKAITNRGKEFPVNAVLSISDEEVAKLEGNRLIALNPGSVEVRAIVVDNGRQLISEPVEVKVVVTFASLKEYLSKLKNTNQIPHPVYMRLFNHLKQAEQHKLNGRTDQAKHHLYKTIEWLEKENRKIDHSIKNDLSIDIQFLIHHLDK